MRIDITIFNRVNVIDCCAIWNILSSSIVYSKALANNCFFSVTKFVEYECLVKVRSRPSSEDILIQQRLRNEIAKGKFQSHALTISDLQEVEILGSRKKLGMGELSSIAFARKINQCFLTDDQPARKLASTILGVTKVQTTPQLVGYLFYERHIIDGDLEAIVQEHKSFNRPLERYFREVYEEALRIQLAKRV